MTKKGFTLSEVLMAIFVLGLLAAVLVPTLTKSAPDRNKIMFKKAYFSLERAVSLMINDNANYPVSKTITLADGVTYQKGFNYTAATTNGTANKFCYFLSQTLNTVGQVTCRESTDAEMTQLLNFRTSDGIAWGLYFASPETGNSSETSANANDRTVVQFPIGADLYDTKVLIDVNGAKEPNCSLDINASTYTPYPPDSTNSESFNYQATCKKPDRFIISVRYDGKLRVGMSNHDNANITDQNAIDILQDPTNNK